MPRVANDRLMELEELTEYIKKVEIETTMLLQSLNWDKKHLQKKKILSTCPIDVGHRLPESKLKSHLGKCKLQSEGYSKDEILLPDLPVDIDSPSVVKFSTPAEVSLIIGTILNTGFTKERLPPHDERPIPQSSGRIQSTYSQDERRALHDYVASKAHIKTNADELCLFGEATDRQSGESESNSYLKLLADKRDNKRRRTKYRKVSTKSRSHTEVLREVIKNQMEVFIEVAQEQIKKKTVKDNTEEIKSLVANNTTCNTRTPGNEGTRQKFDIRVDSYRLEKSKGYRKYDDYNDNSTNSKSSANNRYDKYNKDKYKGRYEDLIDYEDKKCKNDVHHLHKEMDGRRYRVKSHDEDNRRRKRDNNHKESQSSSRRESENRKDRHDKYFRDTCISDKDIKHKHKRENVSQEIDHYRASKRKKKEEES